MVIWIVLIAIVIAALVIDLGVVNKTPHEIKTKEAVIWTSVWVTLALLFSGVIYLAFDNEWIANPTQLSPNEAVLKYLTGYLIELSLSIDNVFIIALIFSSFAIPKIYQHEVLFYGVLGAIVFRALMIVFGVALITKFSWMIYVFGIFLIITAGKMLWSHGEQKDPKQFKIYRWISKLYPVSTTVDNGDFFAVKNGVKHITPLFVALIIIEMTDVFFAIDSIPAILAISADPFIVFSSNILAIMGLRSMFFLITEMLDKFKYISYSLVVILGFVGIKMLISHQIQIPEWVSLGVIILALTAGMLASKWLNTSLTEDTTK